jgi:trimeric autotransporter adhesin
MTKSFKRVAIVAAAALTLGGLTGVAANATVTLATTPAAPYWNVVTAYSGTGDGTYSGSSNVGYQTVGSVATVKFYETATITNASDILANFGVSGAGSVTQLPTVTGGATLSVPGATTVPDGTAVAYPTQATGYDIWKAVTASTAYTVSFNLYSLVTGAQTVTANVLGTNYTVTINWIAASSAGISATNSKIFLSSTTCGTAATVGAATTRAAAADVITSEYYSSDSNYLCIFTFDANGNPVTPTIDGTYSTIGTVSASSASDNAIQRTVLGNGAQTGAATITAILEDAAGNVVTLTTPITFYGKVASLTLANNVFADRANSSSGATNQPAALGDSSSSTLTEMDAAFRHTLALTAKDANGNVVPFAKWSTVNPDLATGKYLVVSDHGNGNAASVVGQSNAFASLTAGTANDKKVTSSNNGGMNVACSYTHYEKLTITAYAYSSATGLDSIASNPVTFYCSGAPATLTVTPSASSASAGDIVTVDASAVDVNGYPVPDATSLSLGSSGGGAFLGSDNAPTTVNGSITGGAAVGANPSKLVVGALGDNIVTVVATNAAGASITANATVSVDGGVSLANDAATAAQDAANSAAEAADNATQAANDALAAVNSLAVQVATLIAGLKSQLTSLSNLVSKISKKVGVK